MRHGACSCHWAHDSVGGGRRRIPRSAGSEGCCGAGRATPGHAVIASGCRRRTAPRDRRARTVRSPPHRLRGGRLWEQACRGSADSCETGRAIGRALAKKRRPRRLLQAAAARGSTRVPHRTLAKRGGCNGRARPAGAGLRHGMRGRRRRACANMGAVGLNAKRACNDPSPPAFRALDLTSAESWQDMRAVHDSRGQCSEKGPSLARSARYAFPKGDLRGFSDTWRAYLAKASSFWIHGGDMLPGRGAFPVRGPFGDA